MSYYKMSEFKNLQVLNDYLRSIPYVQYPFNSVENVREISYYWTEHFYRITTKKNEYIYWFDDEKRILELSNHINEQIAKPLTEKYQLSLSNLEQLIKKYEENFDPKEDGIMAFDEGYHRLTVGLDYAKKNAETNWMWDDQVFIPIIMELDAIDKIIPIKYKFQN